MYTVTPPSVSGGLTLSYGSAGVYGGWDRFGRVVDQKWTNAAGTTTLDEYTYAYDYNSNRTSRGNALQSSLSETYAYDGLDRLVDANRNGANYQDWTLDSLGNWRSNTTAGGTQSRTSNAANEIGAITGSGVDWIDPVYDKAGNMASGPKASSPTTRIHYVYDAWNRLVAAKNDSGGNPGTTLVAYEYDGANRRMSRTAGGSTCDNYYNEAWQTLEVRQDGSANPREQYVYDLSYIDAPVLRFYDGDHDGNLSETGDGTLCFTADANHNITGLIDPSGSVAQRSAYDSYGARSVFTSSWSASGDGYDLAPGWQGLMRDPETLLWHARNREVASGLGRPLQRDPAGYVDGANQYVFELSEPNGNSDPFGLATLEHHYKWKFGGVKINFDFGVRESTEDAVTDRLKEAEANEEQIAVTESLQDDHWTLNWSQHRVRASSYGMAANGCCIYVVTLNKVVHTKLITNVVRLPDWDGLGKAPQPLKEKWQVFLGNLLAHELTHVLSDYLGVQALTRFSTKQEDLGDIQFEIHTCDPGRVKELAESKFDTIREWLDENHRHIEEWDALGASLNNFVHSTLTGKSTPWVK